MRHVYLQHLCARFARRGDECVENVVLVRLAGNRTERRIGTPCRRHHWPAVGEREVDAPAPWLGRAAATGMSEAKQDLSFGSDDVLQRRPPLLAYRSRALHELEPVLEP